MKLSELRFPLYNIRNVDTLEEIDGVLMAHTAYASYIIDNKNLAGSSLGLRRLRIESDLYRLGNVVPDLLSLATEKHTTKRFVDSNGKLFKYYKGKYVTVKSYKVKELHEGNVVALWGTSIPYRIKDCLAYVQLLHTSNQGRLVYTTSDTDTEDFKIWI